MLIIALPVFILDTVLFLWILIDEDDIDMAFRHGIKAVTSPCEDDADLGEGNYWELYLAFSGNASVLVRLIQDEICKVEQIGSYSEEELQNFLTQCSIPWEEGDSKVITMFFKHRAMLSLLKEALLLSSA